MPYIYENDPTKIGTNLQTAVAYLLSLHKNEYEWNLLGIKVVGVKEALPIPDGTYDYGDAYMIGTEADGYEMWIFTRADEAHSEAYWFNVGAFPKPGPQGPKGDGLEQINTLNDGSIKSLIYNYNGYEFTSDASVSYKDSTTGEDKTQHFTMISQLPIVAGNYITLNKNNDYKRLEVKVDDKVLAQDYIKIHKAAAVPVIPQINNGVVTWFPSSTSSIANSIPQRNANGDCNFRKLNFEFIGFKDGNNPSAMYYYDIYNNTVGSDYFINKTPTNTGTLTNTQLAVLQNIKESMNLRIVYDNKVYYRMHEQNAPNLTLKYIHLDSIEDGNGGYKAKGKLFSVKVSTRAWKVVDLDFGGDGGTRTTHNLIIRDGSSNNSVYFTLVNNRPDTYEGSRNDLFSAINGTSISCTVNINGTYYAGVITTIQFIEGGTFKIYYGEGQSFTMAQEIITDNMV